MVKTILLQNITQGLGLGRILWINIKMDLREIKVGGMDWVLLAWGWNQWRALVDIVMNLRVP
jgi:hypothetical protein